MIVFLTVWEMKGQTELKKKTPKNQALQTRMSSTKIPYTDLKPLKKFILKKWKKSWDDQTQNKLHHIEDTIGEWPAGYKRNRKDFVLVTPTLPIHTS